MHLQTVKPNCSRSLFDQQQHTKIDQLKFNVLLRHIIKRAYV